MQFVKGQIGAIIIIIAIMGSVLGGFMLNASNVTGCTTNYKYVTDVAGAFSGTGADMEVEYNPYANISGYTVYDPMGSGGNLDYVHGISYTQTQGSSGYWIETLDSDTEMYPMDIHSDTDSDQATIQYGDYTYTWTQVQGAGHYHVATTIFSYSSYSNLNINGSTIVGVNLITISDIMSSLKASKVNMDVSQFILSIDDFTANGYPGFIGKVSYTYKETSTDKNYIFTAGCNSSQITVYPKTNTCDIADQKGVALTDVYLAWGSGSNHSENVSIMATSGGHRTNSYIDPAYGVIPIKEDVTRSVSTYEQVFSDKLYLAIQFKAFGEGEAAKGSIYYTYSDDVGNEQTVKMVDWSVTKTSSTNISLHAIFYKSDGSRVVTASATLTPVDNATATMIQAVVYLSSGEWTQFSVGSANDSGTVSYENLITKTVTTPMAGKVDKVRSDLPTSEKPWSSSYLQRISYTLTDGTEHVQTSDNASYTQSVTENKWITKKIEYHTNTTYWYNGYDVSSMSIVFPKTAFDGKTTLSGTDVFKIFWNTANGYLYSNVTIELKDDYWYVNTIPIGNWPAISVRIYKDISGTPYLGVIPIQSFDNFINYTEVSTSEIPVGLAVLDSAGKEVSSYKITSLKMLLWDCTKTVHRHEVVNTVVFLESGGLYTQDGVFNEKQSFPNDTMVKLRIMSAVHVGDGITIKNSAGEKVFFKTDRVSNWVDDAGNVCAFADLSIFYVDKSVPAVVIDGKTYKAGMYYTNPDGSKTFIEKGYLYYQFGTNGAITKVGEKESTNDWSVTLNGVWAMSTSYSTGENVGSSHVEWDGLSGLWAWTDTDTVLVFSGICLLMLVLCAWRYQMSGLDWAIGLCGVIVPFFMWAI